MIRGILDKIRAQGRFLHDSGQHAADGVSRYSDAIYNQEEFGDTLGDLVTFPKRIVSRMRGERPTNWKGLARGLGRGLEYGVANPLYNVGLFGYNMGRGAITSLTGANMGAGLAVAGGQLLMGAGRAATAYESIGRLLLTGHRGGPAIDGWFPGWRKFDWGDTRKYAANPRIVRRYVGARAIGAVGAGVSEMLTPKAAPASFYLGAGGDLRHVNDMGVGASYAQSVMGPSIFNGGGQFQMSPQATMAMIDAII